MCMKQEIERAWTRRFWLHAACCAVALVLVIYPRPAHAAGVFLGFQADTLSVAPGATFTVELRTLQAGDAFNAFDASVLFDGSALTFVPLAPVSKQCGSLMTGACASTFHRFSAQPESLAITLVLLCNEVSVSDADVLYRVMFTAGNMPGWTRLRLGYNTQFYLGGTYLNRASARDMLVHIVDPPALGVGNPPRLPAAGIELGAPRPNPARGAEALIVSLSLQQADDVTLELLDTLGRRVAARPREYLAPGMNRVHWGVIGLAPGRYLLRARTGRGLAVTRSWVVLR